MFVRALINIIVLALAILVLPRISWANATPSSGIWSKSGETVSSTSRMRAYSPDGSSFVEYDLAGWRFQSGAIKVDLGDILSPPELTEIIWARDSSAFAINTSDGGETGTWDSYIYIRSKSKDLHKFSARSVMGVNKTDVKSCNPPEVLNVATIAIKSKNEVLCLTQVPPHSSCADMGQEKDYRLVLHGGEFEAKLMALGDLSSLIKELALHP